MKIKTLIATAIFSVSVPISASAQDVLTGDTKLACEAILCLAAPTRPGECASAIAKYFSISLRRFSQTLRARRNFLNLCPQVDPSAIDHVINTYPPEPDPPEPPPPIQPGAPATRSEIEARLAYLLPLLEQKTALVIRLRERLDQCIARGGANWYRLCEEQRDTYESERVTAESMNEEVARLQNQISNY